MAQGKVYYRAYMFTHLGSLHVCGRMPDHQPVVAWLGSWIPRRTSRLIVDEWILVDKHSDATFQYDVQTEKYDRTPFIHNTATRSICYLGPYVIL